MKTSAAGRAAIIAREGKRLFAYRDSVGVLTIGVGHTGRMAPPNVTPGMRISEAECDAFLIADLAPVESVIKTSVKVPLTQNEFDALASLGFNIGVNGLRRSSVVGKLNLGDVNGAAAAFMAWSKPAVLIGRRRAEKAQFLTPDRPAEGAPGHSTATDRATLLSRRAEAAKRRADGAQLTGAGLAVGGVATAAATHVHHPWLAIGFGGGILLAAAIAAAVAILGKRTAQTLEINAGRQTRNAAVLAVETQHIEA